MTRRRAHRGPVLPIDKEIAAAQAEADADTLTGLLNRRGWERAVARSSAAFPALGDPTVVVMLDLDRLKVINDEQATTQATPTSAPPVSRCAAPSATTTSSPASGATSSA